MPLSRRHSYVSAPPGEVYWREEVCPHRGAKVLLRTVGGTCVTGAWYGPMGFAFTAWSPMPKDGLPPAVLDVAGAPLLQRLRFAFTLIFQPAHLRQKP